MVQGPLTVAEFTYRFWELGGEHFLYPEYDIYRCAGNFRGSRYRAYLDTSPELRDDPLLGTILKDMFIEWCHTAVGGEEVDAYE